MKKQINQETFFSALKVSEESIKTCLRVFYGFLFFEFLIDIVPDMTIVWRSQPSINYLGIFSLVELIPLRALLVIGLVSGWLGLIGQVINPFNRWTQVLSFLYVFVYHCVEFGETGVAHEILPYFWVSLIVCFMPHIPRSRKFTRVEQLQAFYVYRSMLLIPCFFFFGAGFWKIYYGLVEGNLFSINALSAHIAIFYNGVGWIGPLGKYLLENPVLGYIGYITVIVFEVTALLNLVFPRLNRPWILMIFTFVMANYFIFEIEFFRYLFLCAVIFYFSPLRLFVSRRENIRVFPKIFSVFFKKINDFK